MIHCFMRVVSVSRHVHMRWQRGIQRSQHEITSQGTHVDLLLVEQVLISGSPAFVDALVVGLRLTVTFERTWTLVLGR